MRDPVQRATSRPLAKGLASAAVALGLLHGAPALAQRTVAPAIDRRLQPQPSGKGEKGEEPSAWRGSTFSWNNSATTETLGIGDDVQSENPTYEMSFALSPRYYVWERKSEPSGGTNSSAPLPASVALGARIETIREFTNSDTTTEQGEWLLSNLLLTSQFSQGVHKKDGYETTLALRAPAIALPTSKAARNNGTIFGLGARLIGVQNLPLLGENSQVLPSFGLTGVMGYDHAFRQTTTPTNPELERERMGLDGETLPSDQLSGRAFTDDEVLLGFSTTLVIHERVRWSNLFEWHLQWRYRFEEDVEAELPTGPAPVEQQENPDIFGVVSLFASEISVAVVRELSVELGYQNLASQIGPDAQRRSMFYSPDARFSLSVVLNLDAAYDLVSGNSRSAAARSELAPGGNL
jgi:hypothetical protein